MDTNGDKKVTYKEFVYWRMFAKKGDFRSIVDQQAENLKLSNQADEEMKESSIKIKVNDGISEKQCTEKVNI